jgi:hypothetical protein
VAARNRKRRGRHRRPHQDPDQRLEVYREPAPDAAAPFAWRYGRVVTLGADEQVAPLLAPPAQITVAELLP